MSSEAGGGGAAEQERIARELAEELRKLRVEDVLVNTLMHVSSIGYRRLGLTDDTREDRDLEQSRLAIETMRALTPVLEKFVPGDLVRDFNTSVANLQLAYAKVVSEADPSGVRPPTRPEATTEKRPEQAEGEDGTSEEDTSGVRPPPRPEETVDGGDGDR
jgi:hypothetical protein